ncbi:MAG: hypothetical protein JWO03_2240 [Bacteroidetes bacterium]|nr:hypothetical protein [Bacteroidota bacterium]
MNPFANFSTEAKKTFKIGGAVLIVTILLFLLGKHCNLGCNRTTTTVTHDTIVSYRDRTDTLYKHVATYVPVVQRELRHDTIWQIINGTGTMLSVRNAESTQDTTWYTDSLYQAKEFKAVINDIITGNRIARRSVFWSDLTPLKVLEEKTTITKTKSPFIKVYLGADGMLPVNNILLSRFDVVPGAALVFADQYMVDVGYGLFGQQLHAGLKIKLAFSK